MDPASRPDESRPESEGRSPTDPVVASGVHHSSALGVSVPSAPALPREAAALLSQQATPEPESGATQEASHPRVQEPLAPPQAGTSGDERPQSTLSEAPSIARCGRFDLVGRLARGGMAEIFLARETVGQGLTRNIVVKVLRKPAQEQEGDGRFEQLFLREGQVAAQLTHPNICHVYEFGRHLTNYYIAMEYVEGASLRQLTVRLSALGEKLEPELAAWIFTQVASALHYAHTARDARREPLGVVHRDVSPQNIMVRYDGVVKLLDFGVAHVAAAEGEQSAGLLFGKIAYMAPEQCLGQQNLDGRADVFSLGVCLYEALTGKRLYRRKDDMESLQAVIKEPPASIRDVDPSLPVALERIVMRALAKDREDRFATADEMAQALDAYLAESGQVVNASSAGSVMRRLFADQVMNGQEVSTEIDISDFHGSKPSVLQARSKLRPVGMRAAKSTPVKRPATLPLRAVLVIAAAVAVAAWLAMRAQDVPEAAQHASTPAVETEAVTGQPAAAEPQSVDDRQGEGLTPKAGEAATNGLDEASQQGPGVRGPGRGTRPGFVESPGF